MRPTRKNIFIPTSTEIQRIPQRTIPEQRRKSGSRREGRITHFVAGLGTSGTFVGTTRRLKELNPRIRCISMQPDSSFHGLEGLKHMATAIVPAIYDPDARRRRYGRRHRRCATDGEAAGARGRHSGGRQRGSGAVRVSRRGAALAEAASVP